MALWEDLVSTVENKMNEAKQFVADNIPNAGTDQQANNPAIPPGADPFYAHDQQTNNPEPAPIPQQQEEKPFWERAKDDLVNTVSNYLEGAKQGYQELAKAQTQNNDTQMQQTINQLSGSNYDQNATDQSQAYENKALTNFGSETALPALAFTGVGTVPAVGAMLAKNAADTYQNTEGTPLEKAGNAIRADWYGPIVDDYNNPNIGQQFSEKPVSTGAKIGMDAVQAVFPLLAAKYGAGKIGSLKDDLVNSVESKMTDATEQPSIAETPINKDSVSPVSQEPLPNDALNFTSQAEHDLSLEKSNVVDTLTKSGIDPSLSQNIAENIINDRRKNIRANDDVTGYQKPEYLQPTLDRAWNDHTDNGNNYSLASVDFANLGGLNQHVNNISDVANSHFRNVTDIIKQSVEDSGIKNAQFIRSGGDEFQILAPGVDKLTLDNAMENARMKVNQYAQETGLDSIIHPKTGLNSGIGIHYGVEDMGSSKSIADLKRNAEAGLSLSKQSLKEGVPNVRGSEAETPGSIPLEGQTAGIKEGAGTDYSAGEKANELESPNNGGSFNLKQPWQMTKDEFNNQAWYHGADNEHIANIKDKGNMSGASSTYITRDPMIASGFPNRGGNMKPGEVAVVLDSHQHPNFNVRLEDMRNDAESSTEKALTLSRAGQRESLPVSNFIPREASTNPHKYLIEKALSEGKSVPPEVLKEYPDLQAKEQPIHQQLVDAVEQKMKQSEPQPDPYANNIPPISDTEIGKGSDPYATDKNPYGNSEPNPIHQDLVDTVEAQLKPSKNIVKNFYDQSLSPIVQGAVESAKNLRDFISSASVNDFTRNTADTIRQYNSERKLSTIQAEKALQDAHSYFAKKSTPEQLKDAIAYQKGELNDPAVKPIIDVLQEQLNSRGQQLKDIGRLDDFEENYLPQIWADTPKNKEILSNYKEEVQAERAKSGVNTPNLFKTASGFLKKKLVPDYDYGLNTLKLEPKYTNPVDMATFRIAQEDKFIMGDKIKQELTDSGDLKVIKPKPYVDAEGNARITTPEPPDGWTRVGKPGDYMWDTRQGVYYARPEVARIIENFINKGWQDTKPYQGWMKVANTMNQFQLLGGFHIGFTSMDTMVSKATLIPKLAEDSIRNIAKGNFKQAASNVADAVVKGATVPTSPFTTALKGRSLISDLLDKGKQNDPIVRSWKAGGGKIGLPEEFTTQYSKSLRKSVANNDLIAAGLKLPFVIAEKLSGVITDKVVPWQKAGVFKELMGYELKKNPELINNQKQLRSVSAKVMDTIDNRLGQVNWDNLFLDPKFKQFMFATMRAPGWTGGTLREIGGGLLDAAQTKKRLAAGDSLITHRMAYNIALPITSLIVNGALQAMLTGNQPDWSNEWKSLMFKYKNGTQGSLGETNYSTSPSYMKDIHAWSQDAIGTGLNKLHPALAVMAQLYKNKDYFNTQITNPDDNILDKTADRAKYVAKQYAPFSYSNYEKLKEQGTSPVQQGMTFFGLNPAPSDLTATDAQKKVKELMTKIEITKTPEQAEKSKMISQARHDLASGKISQQDIYKMFQAGKVDEKEAKDIIKNKDTPALARAVTHFSVDDVIKVYNISTPEEKAQLKTELIKKLDTSFHSKETSDEQKKRYYELFKSIH
ncbi:MAG TPA: diguanylate cyclase [Negativicutes bacterium]|jgi:GGDEF domain-containing protein